MQHPGASLLSVIRTINMGLTYYDEMAGVTRIKRRYVWALVAYFAGFISGMVIVRFF